MCLWIVTALLNAVICLSYLPGGLALAIEGPSKAKINCVDNKDGTCSVTYFPTKPGQYEIVVKFADKDIPGSPFKAQIVGKFLVDIVHRNKA